MAVSIVETLSGTTMFVDNATYLSQYNWSQYFGKNMPSGVLYEGLSRNYADWKDAFAPIYNTNTQKLSIYTGRIFANGYYISSGVSTQFDPPTSGEVDCLLTLAVYSDYTIKMLKYTNLSANVSDALSALATKLEQVSNLQSATEIPIAYGIYGHGWYDVRNVIIPGDVCPDTCYSSNMASSYTSPVPGVIFGADFVQAMGGIRYSVELLSTYAGSDYTIYPLISVGHGPTYVHIKNKTGSALPVKLPKVIRDLKAEYYENGSSLTDSSTYKSLSLANGADVVIELAQTHHSVNDTMAFGFAVNVYS